MNVALRRPMTVAEFLVWEEDQEERWEFDGFQPVAMVGSTLENCVICSNLVAALRPKLRGTPCRVFSEAVKILADQSIRYPDVFIACGPAPLGAVVASDPVVVFEVESPGTSHVDHGRKNAEYRATPSILRYVIVAQNTVSVHVWERRGPDWIGTLLTGPEARLELPEIDAVLTLAEIYEDVTIP